ncbi:MAG: hypothetical protein CVV20_04205 [Gemmatimonadetes bacterium HGW-Gemmatimonadetes-1]|nr:MAG: hypothetical protein CVV20_04205 [Gemmatimonadetes bacterium HGW-Gemmatimonadetes-1]
MRPVAVVMAATMACSQGGGVVVTGDLRIAGAEFRIAPVAATSAAGYWELSNSGSVPDTIIQVSSEAGALSIHRSVIENGLRLMQPVAALEIIPGQTVRFAPGGLHLMLEHFRQPLEVGDTVPIILHMARGGIVTVNAPVRLAGDDD